MFFYLVLVQCVFLLSHVGRLSFPKRPLLTTAPTHCTLEWPEGSFYIGKADRVQHVYLGFSGQCSVTSNCTKTPYGEILLAQSEEWKGTADHREVKAR